LSTGIKAYFRIAGKGRVVLEKCLDQEFCFNLLKSGYADINGNLDVLEAAHLLALGRIAVDNKTGWEEALRVLSELGINISTFLVYHDLRKRGRRVKLGSRSGTLVVDMGSRRFEVLILEEGKLMTLEELAEWSRSSIASGYEPVVAIVDMYGVITYYEARVTLEIQ